MKRLILLFSILFGFQTVSGTTHTCASGFTYFSGACYLAIEAGQSFNLAEPYCATLSPKSHLVTILSQAEQDYVDGLFVPPRAYPIGLVQNNNSQWIWIDGKAVPYSNLRRTPMPSSGCFMAGAVTQDGKWDAVDCDFSHLSSTVGGTVCKYYESDYPITTEAPTTAPSASGECVDSYPPCNVSYCFEPAYVEWFKDRCQKTCGYCGVSTTTTTLTTTTTPTTTVTTTVAETTTTAEETTTTAVTTTTEATTTTAEDTTTTATDTSTTPTTTTEPSTTPTTASTATTTATTSECKDSEGYNCANYKAAGLCEDPMFESMMQSNCALTCGFCVGPSTTTTTPYEEPAQCAGYAGMGLCNDPFLGEMVNGLCPTSCAAANETTTTGTTTTGSTTTGSTATTTIGSTVSTAEETSTTGGSTAETTTGETTTTGTTATSETATTATESTTTALSTTQSTSAGTTTTASTTTASTTTTSTTTTSTTTGTTTESTTTTGSKEQTVDIIVEVPEGGTNAPIIEAFIKLCSADPTPSYCGEFEMMLLNEIAAELQVIISNTTLTSSEKVMTIVLTLDSLLADFDDPLFAEIVLAIKNMLIPEWGWTIADLLACCGPPLSETVGMIIEIPAGGGSAPIVIAIQTLCATEPIPAACGTLGATKMSELAVKIQAIIDNSLILGPQKILDIVALLNTAMIELSDSEFASLLLLLQSTLIPGWKGTIADLLGCCGLSLADTAEVVVEVPSTGGSAPIIFAIEMFCTVEPIPSACGTLGAAKLAEWVIKMKAIIDNPLILGPQKLIDIMGLLNGLILELGDGFAELLVLFKSMLIPGWGGTIADLLACCLPSLPDTVEVIVEVATGSTDAPIVIAIESICSADPIPAACGTLGAAKLSEWALKMKAIIADSSILGPQKVLDIIGLLKGLMLDLEGGGLTDLLLLLKSTLISGWGGMISDLLTCCLPSLPDTVDFIVEVAAGGTDAPVVIAIETLCTATPVPAACGTLGATKLAELALQMKAIIANSLIAGPQKVIDIIGLLNGFMLDFGDEFAELMVLLKSSLIPGWGGTFAELLSCCAPSLPDTVEFIVEKAAGAADAPVVVAIDTLCTATPVPAACGTVGATALAELAIKMRAIIGDSLILGPQKVLDIIGLLNGFILDINVDFPDLALLVKSVLIPGWGGRITDLLLCCAPSLPDTVDFVVEIAAGATNAPIVTAIETLCTATPVPAACGTAGAAALAELSLHMKAIIGNTLISGPQKILDIIGLLNGFILDINVDFPDLALLVKSVLIPGWGGRITDLLLCCAPSLPDTVDFVVEVAAGAADAPIVTAIETLCTTAPVPAACGTVGATALAELAIHMRAIIGNSLISGPQKILDIIGLLNGFILDISVDFADLALLVKSVLIPGWGGRLADLFLCCSPSLPDTVDFILDVPAGGSDAPLVVAIESLCTSDSVPAACGTLGAAKLAELAVKIKAIISNSLILGAQKKLDIIALLNGFMLDVGVEFADLIVLLKSTLIPGWGGRIADLFLCCAPSLPDTVNFIAEIASGGTDAPLVVAIDTLCTATPVPVACDTLGTAKLAEWAIKMRAVISDSSILGPQKLLDLIALLKGLSIDFEATGFAELLLLVKAAVIPGWGGRISDLFLCCTPKLSDTVEFAITVSSSGGKAPIIGAIESLCSVTPVPEACGTSGATLMAELVIKINAVIQDTAILGAQKVIQIIALLNALVVDLSTPAFTNLLLLLKSCIIPGWGGTIADFLLCSS